MIEVRNSERLQRWLLESGHLGPLWDRPRFLFDEEEFERELEGVRVQYPHFTADEAEARAALRLMGKEEGRGRAIVAGHRRRWTRRERMFLLAVIALAAAIVLLLCVPRAHAQELPSGQMREGFRSALLDSSQELRFTQGGQPGGIIIRLANSGTVLATMPAGLLQFNCSSGMSCSWAAGSGSNPPTFTLTSTGGGGSGCIPPGTTANALLFDAGSGTCSDVTYMTWNSSTGTIALASGGTLNLTSGTVDVPGTNGQLLYNNGGVLAAEDPVVSGPDARGAAQSKNPVAGLGGIDYTTNCSSGPCVQEAKVDSSGNQYVNVTNASLAVTGTFWQTTQPVSWSGQSVSLTGSWPYSGTLGAVSLTGSWPYSGLLGSVSQSGSPWGVNVTQWDSTALGAPSAYGTSPGAVTVPGVNAYVTNTVPVSGTFWQTTQPVSCTTSNCAVEVYGHAGAAFDAANGASAPANNVSIGCEYLSSLPSLSSGQVNVVMCDSSARQVMVGAGTAGTAAGGVVSVQGVASMTPVEVSPTTSANSTSNPFFVEPGDGTSGMGTMANFGTGPGAVKSLNVNASVFAGTTAVVADPCQVNTKSYFATQLTASGQIITGTSGKHTYICSWNDITGAAQNYAVVEGTGTTCGTSTATVAGLSGGTTAATGWNMAANTGHTFGAGGWAIAEAANATGDNVCVLISASGPVNVGGSYVQQ